eukprot:3659741-Rhodomonas_salina.1
MALLAYICFKGEILTEMKPKETATSKKAEKMASCFACVQAAVEEGGDAAGVDTPDDPYGDNGPARIPGADSLDDA